MRYAGTMSRLPVTPEELARAIEVWLAVMPRTIWRELEVYYEAQKAKRGDSKPDVGKAVAAHIVGHFHMAKWEITRPEPEHPAR